MTYHEAVCEWLLANPNAHRMPDHAKSTLVDGVWHMRASDGTNLGRVDDMTGRYLEEGT